MFCGRATQRLLQLRSCQHCHTLKGCVCLGLPFAAARCHWRAKWRWLHGGLDAGRARHPRFTAWCRAGCTTLACVPFCLSPLTMKLACQGILRVHVCLYQQQSIKLHSISAFHSQCNLRHGTGQAYRALAFARAYQSIYAISISLQPPSFWYNHGRAGGRVLLMLGDILLHMLPFKGFPCTPCLQEVGALCPGHQQEQQRALTGWLQPCGCQRPQLRTWSCMSTMPTEYTDTDTMAPQCCE